jgi:putative sterol carrier protein
MPIDLSAPPARVYAQVETLDEEEFAALMAEPASRDAVINALVDHFAGTYRGDEEVDAVIHIKLWDKPEGGYDHWELVLADGRCTASEEPTHEPRLTLKVRPTDLRKIVAGEAGPRRLALTGRLRVLGDIRFGMKLQELFAL